MERRLILFKSTQTELGHEYTFLGSIPYKYCVTTRKTTKLKEFKVNVRKHNQQQQQQQ